MIRYSPRPEDDRLNPSRSHSRYYHLRALRRAIEGVVDRRLSKANYGRLVDLGCGRTPYRAIIAPHVAEYVGVDLPGNPNADHQLDTSMRCDLEDGSADVVLSTQVLEHVESPVRYLAEAQRLLRPGGLLVLSTHGYWQYHPDPEDHWRWTSSGLKKLICDSGLEVLELEGVMGLSASGAQLLQDGLLPRVPSWARKPMQYSFQRLIGVLDRLDGAQQRRREASVFVVVAQKQA